MKSVKTRWKFIEPYVCGKDVLDIGPAELMGTVNKDKLKNSIHDHISVVAKKVVGLEKNEEQVEPLRQMGYNIRHGNAEQFDLSEDFDVIVAGELIEHLSNPGLFLDCVRKHLRKDGVFLLTTPNRFSLPEIAAVLVHNFIAAYSKAIAKHVTCYDENLLKALLSRHGFTDFKVVYYEWVGRSTSNYTIRLLNAFSRRFRSRFLPGLMIAAHLEKK